jgi:hypothetical protein
LLTDEQMERIVVSLALCRGDRGFSEAEGVELLHWASDTMTSAMMLGLVLRGAIEMDWRDGEPVWCDKQAVASGRARKVARKQTRVPRAGKHTQA